MDLHVEKLVLLQVLAADNTETQQKKNILVNLPATLLRFRVRCSSFESPDISAGIFWSLVSVSRSHLRLFMSWTAWPGNLSLLSRSFMVRSMPRMKGKTPVPAIFLWIVRSGHYNLHDAGYFFEHQGEKNLDTFYHFLQFGIKFWP